MNKKILTAVMLLFLCSLVAVYVSLSKDPNKQLYSLLKKYNYNGPAIEKIQLKKTDVVTRQKNTLKIKVKTGKVITLTDNLTEGWSSYQKFSFIYYFKNSHYFLIHCDFYEGGEALLIHDTTGQITYLNSPPLFSPNNKRFLTANFDESGSSESGITIYGLTPQGPIKEWTHSANAENGKWVSNNKIQYTRTTYEPYSKRSPITLERRSGKWAEI